MGARRAARPNRPGRSSSATTSAISYKYEIRRLRDRYVRREFAKAEYAVKVDALRRQYPVLALRARDWVE